MTVQKTDLKNSSRQDEETKNKNFPDLKKK